MRTRLGASVTGVLLAGLLGCAGTTAQDLAPKLSLDLGNGLKMDFVLIKPGTFMMGEERFDNHVRNVTITKPFYIGVHEVTQAQWNAVMGENPSMTQGESLPVEKVSWEDCQRFMAKLKEKAPQGMTCRLPSDAEWEYACRAGSKTTFCFGDDPGAVGEYAWFSGNSDGKTRPVGQKRPNAWGLYDMHGNVEEWCAEVYDVGIKTEDIPGIPPAMRICHVVHGGSFLSEADLTRSASRFGRGQLNKDMDLGCRVVISAQ